MHHFRFDRSTVINPLACLAAVFALAACSSNEGGNEPNASAGTGGAATGGQGGSAAGAGGTAGTTAGAGGTGGAGGSSAGSGGSGGSAGAAGGTAGSGGTGGTGGTGGAQPLPFELTSPVLEEGGEFPDETTCDGANASPELNWGPGPEGTMSYAITFRDETGSFAHWAIWNIPATTLSLPADLGNDIPEGAEQVSFAGGAYGGPCPGNPDPGNEHTYVFTLWALDTADFAGAGNAQGVIDALENADEVLASDTLSGTSLAGN